MIKTKKLSIVICFLAVMFVFPAFAEDTKIKIGTGSKEGVYYIAGKAISKIVNSQETGVSCDAISTAGSIFNLNNVRDGNLEMGIVQSDWQYHAVKGTAPGKLTKGSFEKLRALFSIHTESFTVVARRETGITDFSDLKGHIVNIGNPGSGQRATMEVVMDAMGWIRNDFPLIQEFSASEQSFALCTEQVEAMIYTVGHPNESVSKALRLCNASIIPAYCSEIDKLVKENPYYYYIDIPAYIYPGMAEPVKTFGVIATLVTTSDLDSEVVYKIIKTFFENFETFQKMHPAFQGLKPENMVRDGIIAKLHRGALKYYKEKDLL